MATEQRTLRDSSIGRGLHLKSGGKSAALHMARGLPRRAHAGNCAKNGWRRIAALSVTMEEAGGLVGSIPPTI